MVGQVLDLTCMEAMAIMDGHTAYTAVMEQAMVQDTAGMVPVTEQIMDGLMVVTADTHFMVTEAMAGASMVTKSR